MYKSPKSNEIKIKSEDKLEPSQNPEPFHWCLREDPKIFTLRAAKGFWSFLCWANMFVSLFKTNL